MGDPTVQGNWMGPVATRKAFDAYQRFITELAANGAAIANLEDPASEKPLAQAVVVNLGMLLYVCPG